MSVLWIDFGIAFNKIEQKIEVMKEQITKDLQKGEQIVSWHPRAAEREIVFNVYGGDNWREVAVGFDKIDAVYDKATEIKDNG